MLRKKVGSTASRLTSESVCLGLLNEESVAPRLVELLVPSSDVKLQHALVGLLKNLAIPKANKAALGKAGVIAGLRDMNAWAKERDLLGSVQGGAIGVVKHLCNGNSGYEGGLSDNQRITHSRRLILRLTPSSPWSNGRTTLQ